MEDNDLKYWIAFNAIPGIGRVKFGALEKHFCSFEDAWRADRVYELFPRPGSEKRIQGRNRLI